jgi:electron transfer flavoprotein beta subunit
MKFLVCISKAPDTTSRISFTENDTRFNENGVQYIINPYDEWYALVRALELKEAMGGNVTTITVGPAGDEPIIRKALAIGADDAVRIDLDPKDAFSVAREVAAYAKANGFDVILTGKETIDFNGAQVGAMIAELLDMPYLSMASKLDMNGNTATAQLDVKGGKQVVEVQTPFVISSAKGMAEQRIPNMRGIMAARTKPLQVVAPTSADALVSIKQFATPPAKSACKMVAPENMDELVSLLHNESKVI